MNVNCISSSDFGKVEKRFAVLLRATHALKNLAPRLFSAFVINYFHFDASIASESCVRPAADFTRKSTGCRVKTLTDIVCVDFPGFERRFILFYILTSVFYAARVSFPIPTTTVGYIESLIPLWKSSAWSEREIWDLFGVPFSGNTDLRRILTDYGFRGYPLRKDFPLSGYFEIAYLSSVQRLARFPISLAQEYRNFLFANPWISK